MELKQITGQVTYQPLSGGFWGIVTEEGQKFRPVKGLPEAFQKAGLKVWAEITPAQGFSIYMWGTDVTLSQIRKL